MESSELFQVEIREWVLCPDAQDFGADLEDRDCHLRNTARDHHYLERCMFPLPILKRNLPHFNFECPPLMITPDFCN